MTLSQFFKKVLSRSVVGNCLGIVVLTAALIGGTLLFLSFYTHHGEEVTVPDICGLSQDLAQKKLRAAGLAYEVADTGYVRERAPYSILEQSVRPGTRVKPGRIILLTINAAEPRRIPLPDIANNCSRREAEDKLRILGFRLDSVEYVQGDADWVLSVKVNGQVVAAGARVPAGALVKLVVGNGYVDYEYNGNDSLDYLINAPVEAEDETLGGEETAEEEPEKGEANFE